MEAIHCADFLIGEHQRIIKNGGLVIDRDEIVFVGKRLECIKQYPLAEIIDYPDSVISPGFVNAHMHFYGILAHGLTSPVPIVSFESFLNDYWWPLVENLIDIPMLEAATEGSVLELLDSGVTTVCDILEAPTISAEGLYCEADILNRLHMRSMLSTESSERISVVQGLESLENNATFLKKQPPEALVRSLLCLHTAFTCSRKFILHARDLAREIDCDIQLHLNESTYEPTWCVKNHGMRTALWYERLRLLNNNLLAAQCVQLSKKEIDLLTLRKVRGVHVPISNCEVGGGIAPIPEMLDRGMILGLGTDGYINNFFEVMRAAFLIHKGHQQSTEVMPAKIVWNMATESGAQAVFDIKAKTGTLTPGMKADFQIISIANIPTEVSEQNIFDQLILFRNPDDVTDVYIDGFPVKRRNLLLTGDLDYARAKTREQSKRLRLQGLMATSQ